MVLKLFRHFTINLLLALAAALVLFTVCLKTGVVYSIYFLIVALFLGLTLFLTKELSLLIKNIISLIALVLFYYIFNYLLYIELETTVPSVLNEKSYLEKGLFYLKNSTYKDLKNYWPVFTSSINSKDTFLSLLGLGGLNYSGWRRNLFDVHADLLQEDKVQEKTGATIQKKRKVNSKRFKRRF